MTEKGGSFISAFQTGLSRESQPEKVASFGPLIRFSGFGGGKTRGNRESFEKCVLLDTARFENSHPIVPARPQFEGRGLLRTQRTFPTLPHASRACSRSKGHTRPQYMQKKC